MKDEIKENISLAINLLSILIGLVFVSLIFVFSFRLQEWTTLLGTTMLYLVGYTIAYWFISNYTYERFKIFLHSIIILILFSFFFQLAGKLQHIIFDSWFDETLIAIDNYIIGSETSLYFEKITNPFLTEWMMFSYVVYIPLLPAVSLICYFSSGKIAAEKYLFSLIFIYALCYFGFILFPVASPLFHYADVYNVQLEGGIFAFCGELIRKYLHFPGGALPSPHCAATTIMAVYLFRYNKKIFYWLLPIIITIYFSTVYGRYHYSWDGITGVLAAFTVVKLTPRILNIFITAIDKSNLTKMKYLKTKSILQGELK